ncbi:BnaA09g50830D [Brassica napus]|uniref:BnaA09g50830D protein n=1 Tax=Brassica napus TaxID=3708 RepID=A0A078H6V7_BRANA|nr:BnaA09g50830D [Brassica napus]
MSPRTRVQSFIHRTVKIFSVCLTSMLEDLDKVFDPKRRLISPQSHGSLTASPKTSGIVTVEQDRVSAKARTGSEKQVYRLGLIEEEKSKRKKGKEKEFRLRHHRKGRPELGFQAEGGGF